MLCVGPLIRFRASQGQQGGKMWPALFYVGQFPNAKPSTYMGSTQRPFPRVLLIDDDPDEHIILRHYFKQNVAQLEWAKDPADGIIKALAIKPDIIILDQYIPGFDVIETIRRIKGLKQLVSIPIVISTGLVNPQIYFRLLAEGIIHITNKPIPVSILKNIANLNF